MNRKMAKYRLERIEMNPNASQPVTAERTKVLRELEMKISELGPAEAAKLLESESEEIVIELFQNINPILHFLLYFIR